MKLRIPINEKEQKQGNDSAPLILLEYGDYECPHCAAAHPVIKKLQANFAHQLLFVFRNFPLSEMHPFALPAAYVAEASALQEKFWPGHDLIFENQDLLSTARLLDWAKSMGTDMPTLEKDIRSEAITVKVEKDFEGSTRSGVNGTPGFFINAKRYDDDYAYQHLKTALETILHSEKK